MAFPPPSNIAPIASGYMPNTTAWIAAVIGAGGTVSGQQAAYVNTLEQALTAGSVITLLDRLWLFASENSTQALIDLVARSTATATNSPTFTASQGYAGNGTSSYIDSNFNASTAGGNFAQNSAHYSIYSRSNRAGADATAFGAGAAAGSRNALYLRTVTDRGIARVNLTGAFGGTDYASTDARGMWVGSRTAAGAGSTYRNGSSVSSFTEASAAPFNGNFFIGASNGGGAAGLFDTAQIAICSIGGGLDATKAATLSTAVNAYMTALGTNVY